MSSAPHLIGFDMPGAALSPDQDAVLVALLDSVPDPAWQQALRDHADSFVTEQGIVQLRLIGTHIHFVGPVGRLRVSAAAVQGLLAKVTRARLTMNRTQQSNVGAPQNPDGDRTGSGVVKDVREAEVAAVAGVPDVQGLLAEVCTITGMRFSAVARVTDHRWTTCAVSDLLDFGLQPGQDLILETTICRELRPGQTTSFGKASAHPVFSRHHSPQIYGFESHISVPMILPDGTMFGSLCVLDPKPATLSEDVVARVEAVAAKIASQLKLEPSSL